jgi:hypothetical protein
LRFRLRKLRLLLNKLLAGCAGIELQDYVALANNFARRRKP